MQGVHSNYEIDLFAEPDRGGGKTLGVEERRRSNSLRVIADHIRACAFLIVDGVLPGNEGRGYVLRRIIRKKSCVSPRRWRQGMEILETAIAGSRRRQELSGDVVFKLYDTYGFPVDLTADIARARGLTVDQTGFEAAMQAQRDLARARPASSLRCRCGYRD